MTQMNVFSNVITIIELRFPSGIWVSIFLSEKTLQQPDFTEFKFVVN